MIVGSGCQALTRRRQSGAARLDPHASDDLAAIVQNLEQ